MPCGTRTVGFPEGSQVAPHDALSLRCVQISSTRTASLQLADESNQHARIVRMVSESSNRNVPTATKSTDCLRQTMSVALAGYQPLWAFARA